MLSIQGFNLKVNTGALVGGVLEDQPADRAGLQPGDVVLTLGAGNIGELARKFAAEFRD